MERRLARIAKRAGTPAAVAEPLLKRLAATITSKRQYDELFEDAAGVEAFASTHALAPDEFALLLKWQERKDIFVPNRWLDLIMTALFILECVLVAKSLAEQGMLAAFALALLMVDAFVHRVKGLAADIGRWMSSRLLAIGAVDADPLGGRIQMKKWQEQSWQLAIHVAFSIAEGIILTEETWYTVPATCWIPHPFTQRETGWRADLKGVYVMALAIWIYTCIIHRCEKT